MARWCNRIHLVWHLYYTGAMLFRWERTLRVRPSASPAEGDWARRLRASGLLLLRIRNVFTLLWGNGRPGLRLMIHALLLQQQLGGSSSGIPQ